jgi:hypothetical protein
MSEQHTPLPDDVRTWLAERGQDAYALAWVAPGADPAGWPETEAPRAGETGIARTGADPTRITLQELTRGRPETLRRWLPLDNGTGRLAIISAEHGGLREHTPGELVAHLMRTPDSAPCAGQLQRQLPRSTRVWQRRNEAHRPAGQLDPPTQC